MGYYDYEPRIYYCSWCGFCRTYYGYGSAQRLLHCTRCRVERVYVPHKPLSTLEELPKLQRERDCILASYEKPLLAMTLLQHDSSHQQACLIAIQRLDSCLRRLERAIAQCTADVFVGRTHRPKVEVWSV